MKAHKAEQPVHGCSSGSSPLRVKLSEGIIYCCRSDWHGPGPAVSSPSSQPAFNPVCTTTSLLHHKGHWGDQLSEPSSTTTDSLPLIFIFIMSSSILPVFFLVLFIDLLQLASCPRLYLFLSTLNFGLFQHSLSHLTLDHFFSASIPVLALVPLISVGLASLRVSSHFITRSVCLYLTEIDVFSPQACKGLSQKQQ